MTFRYNIYIIVSKINSVQDIGFNPSVHQLSIKNLTAER